MTKDNLLFALGGTLIGVIVGVLIANSGGRAINATVPTQQLTEVAPPEQRGNTQQQDPNQLPEGHPPVDQAALQAKVAEQEQLLKTDPNNQEATINLANLNFDLKNYTRAIQYYEKALQKDPSNINLITDLGSSYMWSGDYDKAIQLYNQSLSINPKHLQSLMNLGIAKMSTGDKAGAAESWQKVIDYYPNDPEVPMLKQAVAKLKAEQKGS
jgi:tetratricopeptide (TPR) repeat protein